LASGGTTQEAIEEMKKLLCWIRGHKPTPVEEYSRGNIAIRQTRTIGGRTFICPLYEEADVNCKWKCSKCGVIKVGTIRRWHWLNEAS
jgi:hypothetical protein